MQAIDKNKGLVQNKDSQGRPTNKAIWVNDGSDFNPGKEQYRVKITLSEAGENILDSNHINDSDIEYQGEAKHRTSIIIKDNEPRAKGIGTNLRSSINRHIQKIVFEKKDKKGKWKKCTTI